MAGGNLEPRQTPPPERAPRTSAEPALPLDFCRSADLQVLLEAVEQSVVPRLRMAPRHDVHLRSEALAQAAQLGAFDEPQVQAYLDALLLSESRAWDYLQAQVDGGATVPALCLHLMAPAARRLGQLWSSDVFTFADVTIAVGRLQSQLRALSRTLPSEPLQDGHELYHALFCPLPGEQHSLGMSMVSDFYRAAGWYVRLADDADPRSVSEALQRHRIDLLGISVTAERHLQSCAAFIRQCRLASANRRLVVLVGGNLLSERPHLANDLGADGMARDAREAILLGFQLVASRKEGR